MFIFKIIKPYTIFLSFFVIFYFSTYQFSYALTDGILATDLLGQYDQASLSNPVAVYTKSTSNDAPNRLGYSSPSGIVFDFMNHRVFVSDSSNNRVLIYNLNSNDTFTDRVPDNVLGQPNFYTRTAANTQAGMSSPQGLAYDSVNNRLFVAEATGSRVKVFDVASVTNGENAINVLGQTVFTTFASANTQAGMSSPQGLAYDSVNNRLFVAEAAGNRVKVWDVASITDGENAINVLGQAVFTTLASANTQAGVSGPQGLTYDSVNNRLFVSESTGNRVKIYDVASITDGENAINVLGQAVFTTATSANTQAGMSSPKGLAYDSTNNRLFVSESTGNRVKSFDVTSVSDGESAVDLLGHYDQTSFTDPLPLYTTSSANDTPNRFGLNTPQATVIDIIHHRFFVVDTSNNRVLVYNLNNSNNFIDRIADNVLGQPNFYTNTAAVTQAGMSTPNGIAYDSAGDRIFVVEYGGRRVKVYDVASITDGEDAINVLGQADFTSSTSANTQSGMDRGYGVLYDSNNNRLFVAEGERHRIKIWDVASITNGEPAVNILGQADFTSANVGNTQSGLNYPSGMAYDYINNRLFVSEIVGNRVKIYDASSITDGENAINVLGQADFTSSTSANTQSGVNSPFGLAYDSTNSRLFVGENSGHRVKVWDVASITDGENAINVLGQALFTTATAAASQSGMNVPYGITYDSGNDRLFVADSSNHRISIFSLSTTPLSIGGPSGFYNYGVSIPIYITFSNSVTVTGIPTISLATGETIRTASYTSGSGTNTLIFTYVTQPGDFSNDLDYTSTSALSLNGGTIIDNTNNNVATLTLSTPGTSGSLALSSDISIVPPAAVNLSGIGNWTPPWIVSVTTPPVITTTPVVATNTTNTCPATQILTQNLKAGARNGQYHSYTKGIVKEVKILQAHMNRLGFASGKEDGILGPITDGAIKRMQKQLGTTQDGLIGPITRGLINGSCGDNIL